MGVDDHLRFCLQETCGRDEDQSMEKHPLVGTMEFSSNVTPSDLQSDPHESLPPELPAPGSELCWISVPPQFPTARCCELLSVRLLDGMISAFSRRLLGLMAAGLIK